jgi:glycosyltransferase involved in cell wall biosynthesis
MLTFALSLSLLILAGACLQAIPTLRVIRSISGKDRHHAPLTDPECPKTAVLLSLRGADPFLEECLYRLVEQDYPDFEIHIALDHADDPANEYVQRLIREKNPPNLIKRIINKPNSSASMVTFNYAEMIEQLDATIELVVFVDADAVTWPGWLRSLVKPLVRDPDIGGTSGNRWYTPHSNSLGSICRSAWNLGSLTQMVLFEYPWGGSLALRGDIARDPQLLNRYRTAFNGDTASYEVIVAANKKYHFNPEIILLNREKTTFASFCDWMPRQLLNGRLYHPSWAPIQIQALASLLVLTVAFLLNLFNLFLGNWLALGVLLSSLVVYWILYFLLVLRLDHAIGQNAKQQGQQTGWLTAGKVLRLFLVIPLMQAVYFWGFLKCLYIRRVCWRGIEYEIHAPYKIKLLNYHPFQQEEKLTGCSL